jgi:hypothetical protein
MQNVRKSELPSMESSPSAGRLIRKASPTEMIYIATHTTVVSRGHILGLVSRAQLETAVAYLEAKYPVLRAVVEDGYFVERAERRSAVETWSDSETSSVNATYAGLLNAELDTRESLCGIHVVVGDDAIDVFMLSSHAITDATSLIELHSCLSYFCDCVVRGEVPAFEQQQFPNAIDAAVRDIMNTFPENQINVEPAVYSGTFAEIPLRTLRHERSVTHRLERVVIGAEDTSRISAAGHLHGSSVHSLIMAAFALAIRETAPDRPRQMLMRSNVDLRRRLEPHVSTDLVFSAITAQVTVIPDLDRPFFEIAKLAFEDIHRAAADGSILRAYLDYPKTFGSPQQAPVALNISDMQTVRFHWPTEQLKVTGFEYALGWSKKFPNVSVSVYEQTLVANIVYVEEFVDPKIMRMIAERFVRILVSACRGG